MGACLGSAAGAMAGDALKAAGDAAGVEVPEDNALANMAAEKMQEAVEDKVAEKVEAKVDAALEKKEEEPEVEVAAAEEEAPAEEAEAEVEVAVEEPAAEEEAPAAAEEEAPAAAGGEFDDFLTKLEAIKESHPDNLCCKYLTRELFNSYTPEEQKVLYNCARTGVENEDSGVGAYAMTPSDYETFSKFFDPLIRDYHGATPDQKHVTNWDASTVGDNGVLDVSKLGLDPLSIRVRVGRNLQSFNLPGMMDQAERIKFEMMMLKAFQKLIDDPEFGGNIYSLTPDFGGEGENPNKISDEKYQELVDAHVMFKDMAADPYLASAGIASDWPYGRGCYMTEQDGFKFVVWFGEEDCLRVMVMGKTTRIDHVFTRLKKLLDTIESIDGLEFATSADYGYVTSCPSNLGTGMRASVHIPLPNLTADGTDAKAKEAAKPLGLSVRGTGGEHTPIKDNLVDISPRGRL
eukprot:CAMPEP_0181347946 /NCGR_PEP_ID=MMETSP1101-20121128/34146_1 /TAXON_ID=46948 /ORGANISM="Rhodomonas abbreviata, Strain Caron Lab Isolate" /LENGTH=461 /DNA_ID=CAMNT_0023460187 /DNA_START=71 /DNA_END=1453 /DNA_ORIENTATION=+